METVSAPEAPRLCSVLSLWDLILYGIVVVTPSAPVTVFGIALVMSQGHAVDTILLTMVAMIFTRFSHGRIASPYPAAGPAYTYVGRGLTLTSASWLGRLTYPRMACPSFCTNGRESLHHS
jgi:putrescine importer